MNIIKKLYKKIIPDQTRENIVLFFKSTKTRQHLFRKLKIERFSKKNCFYISSKQCNNTYRQSTSKTAIHFHIFYTDLLEEIYEHIKNINTNYDLFVSTNGEEKLEEIKLFFKNHILNVRNIIFDNVTNRGRDVWPFIKMISPVYTNYDFVAHLHTKKSITQGERGNLWRKYLYNNILGNGFYFDNLIAFLEQHKEIGIIAPPPFPDESMYYAYSTRGSMECKTNLDKLFKKTGTDIKSGNPLEYQYSPGNMFISRSSAIKQVFNHKFEEYDFPIEIGQQSNTLHHTMEQCWHYYAQYNGYKYKECLLINK